ncbi:transposase [Streptomyces sp. NPDC058092]|uniref:transposase n=1 Tax=Streptomyces sp. NPDC058092 TaxID=3346336 RepID=UPI0036EF46A1
MCSLRMFISSRAPACGDVGPPQRPSRGRPVSHDDAQLVAAPGPFVHGATKWESERPWGISRLWPRFRESPGRRWERGIVSAVCLLSWQATRLKMCWHRATAYTKAVKEAAPGALEVADRWHLLQNLSAAVEKTCHQHRNCLRQHAEQEPEATVPDPVPMELPVPELPRTQIIERTRHATRTSTAWWRRAGRSVPSPSV